MLFYEYFHGDTGRGVGASHQTGWTALVAKLLHPAARGLKMPDLSFVSCGLVTALQSPAHN